jgi:PAS domain S-box-containing protein
VAANRRPIEGLRVLVVDDDSLIADVIRGGLVDAGCEVVGVADSSQSAIDAATQARPDLILMDVSLQGDMDGVKTAEVIHERMNVPVVYLAAATDQPKLQRAKATVALGYVIKPFRLDTLRVAIEVAIDRFRIGQRLEEYQLTYAAILGSVSDAVITTDVDGGVRFMNAVAERLTGWQIGEAQGYPVSTVLQVAHPAGEPRQGNLVARVLGARTHVVLSRDTQVVSRDGLQIPVNGSAAPVLDNLGRAVGMTITLRDVTETRTAEAATNAIAEQLRAIVDTAVDGVMVLDAGERIVTFNPACERLFGYAQADVLGHGVEQLMPSPLTDDFGRLRPPDNAECRTPLVITARVTNCHRKDGSVFPAELSVGEAGYEGKSVFVCVVHDTSERHALEAALLDAVGQEQRRFGRDLHDGLGQDLTGLSLLLSALVRSATAASLPNAVELEQAASVVRHALKSCGSIARGLSPVSEAQGGLTAGIRDLVERLQELHGPNIVFATDEDALLNLSPSAADHLYRIAQEALANALKHAHAKSITVTLTIEPARVRLEIGDDGDGLRPSAAGGQGLGLRTMRYRAAAIGASISMEARPGAGTRIVCECPQAA